MVIYLIFNYNFFTSRNYKLIVLKIKNKLLKLIMWKMHLVNMDIII